MKVERMKLKDLQVGDKFYPGDSKTELFEVTSNCRYIAPDVSYLIRRCRTSNLKYFDKPAEMEVMKVFTENDF